MVVSDFLLRVVQRGRERHSPPVVNKASVRWPTPSPSTPGLVVEDLEYYVDDGAQGWVPLRIIRPLDERDMQQQQQPSPAGQQQQQEQQEQQLLQHLSLDQQQPSEPGAEAAAEATAEATRAAEAAAQSSTPTGPVAEGGEAQAEVLQAEGGASSPGPPEGVQAAERPAAVRRPLIVFMHATGENMDVVRPKQELYARMGYFTAAIDARYHGQRAAVPWEVAAALNAAAPKLATAPAAAAAASTGDAAAALVATVKGLSPKALAALERADAAAGMKPPAAAAADAAVAAATGPPPPPLTANRTMTRSGTRSYAPAGSRTAKAEARAEAEARERALAHERFVAAWLGAMAEFRERRSAEATTAVLATAPPPPPPSPPKAAPVPTSARDGAVAAAVAAAEAAAAPAAPTAGGAAAARWAVAHGTRGAAVSRADRVTARNVYETALAAAWRGSGEQPLFLDTVWDLVLLLDALALREDVDMGRVGVTGFSMGGSITWLLSVIDPRVSVAAPVAGVQGFGWAVDNESYHGRVSRYPLVFEVAASDVKGAKKAEIDAEVVFGVWEKLLPGLLSFYDAHLSLPSVMPRPLLVVTGETDQQCPLPGVAQAAEATKAKYLEWAKDQRRQHLEAEAVAEMEAAVAARAAAEAAAAEAVEAEAAGAAGGAGRGSRTRGVEGSGGGASAGGKSGASTEGSPSRSRSATDGGAAAAAAAAAATAAAAAEEAEDDEKSTVDVMRAAAKEEAAGCSLASAAAVAEEEAVVALAAAAAAAAAHAAAVAAARAAALAAAAEQQRREEEAIGKLLASRYRYVVEMGVGHVETDSMRRAVEKWMQQHLLEPWMRERIAARAAAERAATERAAAERVAAAAAAAAAAAGAEAAASADPE